MIPEERKEYFRMSERSIFVLHGKVDMYDVINNLHHRNKQSLLFSLINYGSILC